MPKLRRVKVFRTKKYRSPEGRWIQEKEEDKTGLFHGWGMDHEEYELGPGNYTTAIIELPDGTIETPQADMIQFVS